MTTPGPSSDSCSRVAESPEHSVEIADLDTQIEFEREQFQLYERRRIDYESQATTTVAAAVTFAALLVAGADKLSKLGDSVRIGTAVTLVSLAGTIVLASIARYGSWGTASALWRTIRRGEERPDLRVDATLAAYRDAGALRSVEQRRLAYEHWRARAHSAFVLGRFKSDWMKRAGVLLAIPVAFLLLVAYALL